MVVIASCYEVLLSDRDRETGQREKYMQLNTSRSWRKNYSRVHTASDSGEGSPFSMRTNLSPAVLETFMW